VKSGIDNDSIYLAIASYRDQELIATIYSALSNAKNKDRIFFYVFSQDDSHPKIENLFKLFETKKYFYDKEHYSVSTGVGYGRSRTQSLLSDKYKYYFQVDSHTQFSKDWDSRLIADYESLRSIWGNYIFSSYPPGYNYLEYGDIKFETDGIPPVVQIYPKSDASYPFDPKYATYAGKEFGTDSGYFCAGLAFGYSELFLKVPYDKNIFFHGEEHTMSVRFYEQNISIVCPPSVYIFHNYNGSRRLRQWDRNSDWTTIQDQSFKRVSDFFDGKDLDGYGIRSMKKYEEWYSRYVITES
jgi:hypothetical protein